MHHRHTFTTGAAQQKRVPMMHQSGRYNYYEGKNFQAVSLPYGAGRASLYIFLPGASSNLAEFQRNLTAANWDAWMKQFAETEGSIAVARFRGEYEVGLNDALKALGVGVRKRFGEAEGSRAVPRFRVEYEVGLNDALKALGMGVAFDANRADFSGIVQGSERAYISRVKHKTFAEVNEEGTEAAAVTSVEMRTTSARLQRTFQRVVDRPFFCAIRDNKTGTVLFVGSITDPQ